VKNLHFKSANRTSCYNNRYGIVEFKFLVSGDIHHVQTVE
jgi:hypothetical protein